MHFNDSEDPGLGQLPIYNDTLHSAEYGFPDQDGFVSSSRWRTDKKTSLPDCLVAVVLLPDR